MFDSLARLLDSAHTNLGNIPIMIWLPGEPAPTLFRGPPQDLGLMRYFLAGMRDTPNGVINLKGSMKIHRIIAGENYHDTISAQGFESGLWVASMHGSPRSANRVQETHRKSLARTLRRFESAFQHDTRFMRKGDAGAAPNALFDVQDAIS